MDPGMVEELAYRQTDRIRRLRPTPEDLKRIKAVLDAHTNRVMAAATDDEVDRTWASAALDLAELLDEIERQRIADIG